MPAGVRRGRTDIIRALGSLSEKFSKLKEPSQALRSKKNQRDFLPFLHVEGLQGKKGGGGAGCIVEKFCTRGQVSLKRFPRVFNTKTILHTSQRILFELLVER